MKPESVAARGGTRTGFARVRSVLILAGEAGTRLGDGAAPDAMLVRSVADGRAALTRRRELASPLVVMAEMPPLGSMTAADLSAMLALRPDAIVLPEATGAHDIAWLGARLAVAEAELGLADGATRIVARPADAPAGLLALPSLSAASPRLAGVIWDGARLGAALNVAPDSPALLQARTLVQAAARAAGVPIWEVSGASAQDQALAAACTAARRDGFAGLLTTEPAQIGAINLAFAER